MAISPGSAEFTSKIKSVLESNGISDAISKVVVDGSDLKGENFASIIQYVTVEFEEPDKKPLNLFVKVPPTNPAYSKMILEDWRFFKKEAVFFMEYLPKAREYCKSIGQEELLDIYPKHYYLDEELVVLENIVLERGFVLLDKIKKQDFETATLALTNLAKHHAISHALIKEHGGPQSFFRKFPDLKFEFFHQPPTRTMMAPGMDHTIDMVIEMLENSKDKLDGKDEAIELFRSMKGKQFDEALESLKSTPVEFVVLNHGDYWNNNMMFLTDKESGKLTHHITVDYQGTRYGSPCLDLGYYLYMSVQPEVRQKRLAELLEIYLKALKTTGLELGHPIDLSLKELKTDFCNHFQFGYWHGLDVATGAGYAVLKDIDISDFGMDDPNELALKWSKLVGKWMEEHSEECAKFAEVYIDYWKEYDQFKNYVR